MYIAISTGILCIGMSNHS